MEHFWTLWKLQLKQTFSLSYFRYLWRTNRRKLMRQAAIVPLLLVAFGPSIVLLVGVYDALYGLLHPIKQDALVFAMAFVMSQTLALMFGIFYLMSHFYFAKDMPMLMPLPIRPWVILGSKFLTVVISEWGITLPMVLPALYVYGSNANPAWYFWLLSLLITLLLPIIPLALASLFVIILMRVTSVHKGKDLLRVGGAFIGILIFALIQWAQIRFKGQSPQDLLTMLAGPNGLMEVINSKFPPSLWAAKGLLGFPAADGLYNLALFVGVSLIALASTALVAEKFFYKGLLGGSEVSAKRKKLVTTPQTFAAKSLFTALWQREWRNLVRSTAFMMPVLINIIILPIALTVPFLSQGQNLGTLLAASSQNPWIGYWAIFIVAGMMTWISSANSLSSTAISREGSTFWISRIIPVAPRVQLISKLALAAIVPLVLLILVLGVELFYLKFSPVQLIMQLFIALLGSFLSMVFSIWLDAVRPKLDWVDPQHLMKRHFGAVVSTFSIMAFVGLNGLLIYYLGQKLAFKPSMVYAMISGLWLVLLAFISWFLFTRSERYYSKVEL